SDLVQLWRIGQTGERIAGDLTRGQRWERLGEVFRELDHLRDRGEQLIAAARRGELADAVQVSGAAEPDGGDAVGAEVDTAADGSEGPPA
ncbi:MAG: hypothetical protein M0Z62_14995, partial [Actinomycetota bacterium]|nr:hypothetical protein [Actinomycetota bacterium]